jgi:hypothetical protein
LQTAPDSIHGFLGIMLCDMMFWMNRGKWALVALPFLLLGCACRRIGDPPPQIIPNPGSEVIAHESGFSFPDRLGEFERVDVHNYDRSGRDMSVGYNQRRLLIIATIYVYPKSETRPRSSLDQHFDDVRANVLSEHVSARVKESKPITISLSGVPRRGYKAVFSLVEHYAGTFESLRGEVHLFEFKDYFVKYRFTYPERNRVAAEKETARLMQDIQWPG